MRAELTAFRNRLEISCLLVNAGNLDRISLIEPKRAMIRRFCQKGLDRISGPVLYKTTCALT